MKKLLFASILLLGAVLVMGTTPITAGATAIPYTFDDYTTNWPGYELDTRPLIGSPDILNTTAFVEVDDEGAWLYLNKIEFEYLNSADRIFNAGDLFIGLDTGSEWNVVYNTDVSVPPVYVPAMTILQTPGTLYQEADDVGGDGTNERQDHPYALTGSLAGQIINTGSGIIIFDELDLDLFGIGYFTIGFAVWDCANDVIFETVVYDSDDEQVPEPATGILLFGALLIGVSTVGRKKFFKK